MKYNALKVTFLSLSIVFSLVSSVNAQITDEVEDTETVDTPITETEPAEIEPAETGLIETEPAEIEPVDEFGDTYTPEASFEVGEFPVVGIGDWRAVSSDIPWSVPVVVRDDFDGDYLAVFDKNYDRNFWTESEIGIRSNWSRQFIRIYAYESHKNCPAIWCSRTTVTRETDGLKVKVGSEVFELAGNNGNYSVSDELAHALANAPSGQAKIKVYLEESGAEITNDIGEGTVEAWRTVYRDALVQ